MINEHQSQQRLYEPTIKQNPNQPQLKKEIYYNKNEEIKVNRCAKISNNKLQQNYEHLEVKFYIIFFRLMILILKIMMITSSK